MRNVLTAEEMREVDRLTTGKYGISSAILMENAAHAAVRAIAEKLGGSVLDKSFLVICGKGNNGGDGASVARILWTLGASVRVFLLGKIKETKGDARVNFEILDKISKSEKKLLQFSEVTRADRFNLLTIGDAAIIDAVFGTGLERPLDGEIGKIVDALNGLKEELPSTIFVSLDLPSGLNADSNEPIGRNFRADLTITFTAPKLANVAAPASRENGELIIASIGSPLELIDRSPSRTYVSEGADARRWFAATRFTDDSYKNKRGHAFLIAGSPNFSGAAVLAANAAMISGVGLTTLATRESVRSVVAEKLYDEVITRGLPEGEDGTVSPGAIIEVEKIAKTADVIGIGCGLTAVDTATREFVHKVVAERKTPVVIDADGLNALSPFLLQGSRELPLILTPHECEFLRLIGSTDRKRIENRIAAAREFAAAHQVILVLKGERTIIAEPGGKVVINSTGNTGLGKAGNGDTLTGIITGFIAQSVVAKIDIFKTVVAAVYVAGLAGDIAERKFGKRIMRASDVRDCLAEACRELGGSE